MNKLDEAKRLLGPEKAVFLITIDETGKPDARAMAIAKSEGPTLWMMTCKLSDKYRQLSKNPECLLYATDLEDTPSYMELRLRGKIELLDDAESKAAVWRDDYACYFPGGRDDPDLGVLKFTAESGTLQSQAGKEKLAI
ncbi:MAG: pyridoxamine 5'-phosphate oxidase family protein [Candidatus Adiutrix sp.]|jgi:general stress protein 26|nr:pyridoxamine 5'-phosphate oxidase family protein [Candidatus Adiutrix sp.]